LEQEIRFCSGAGGERIAYAVVGSGPALVCPSGWVTHLEQTWDNPSYRAFFERLARRHTVVRYDRLGCGLSDREAASAGADQDVATLETIANHLSLDRFDIFDSQGGAASVRYSVTHPERVGRLILYGALARGDEITDTEFKTAILQLVRSHWGFGSEAMADIFLPGAHEDDRAWYAAFEREAATAEVAARILARTYETDLSVLLPQLKVPTLVIHRQGDRAVPFRQGRELAAAIPDARLLALDGRIHLPYLGDTRSILRAIGNFLGDPVDAEPELDPVPDTSRPPTTVLVTVLFTDIVNSTETAARLGDVAWGELMDGHRALLHRTTTRFGGREIDSVGDGSMAIFESPGQAIECARTLTFEVTSLGLQLRAGIHSGECQLMGDRLRGITVHIGARVAACAVQGEVMVSSTVHDLVAGSGIRFRDRGAHILKGIQGEWRLYTVEPYPDGTKGSQTVALPTFKLN
jgi:class 3 adenylate cyclase/pimeloyl-ACP methyl ester carboxylesterase